MNTEQINENVFTHIDHYILHISLVFFLKEKLKWSFLTSRVHLPQSYEATTRIQVTFNHQIPKNL